MDDGNGVNFNRVYSGIIPDTIVANLTPGVLYSFKVSAVNFNGEGLASPITTLKSCIAPTGVLAPKLISSTDTTITLRWQ